MTALVHARLVRATLLLAAFAAAPSGGLPRAAAADGDAGAEPHAPTTLSLVVMDPLAAPLSCPCVEGYAQRRYDALAEHLQEELGAPVKVTFADSLERALAKKECSRADLIIGKDSVVRADARAAELGVRAIARLTDPKGRATQTGLIVVRAADPAKNVADLKGYRILYGPACCDEKFAAPRRLLSDAGVEVVAADRAEVSSACSDGACKIVEWGDTQKAAAVISSYAAPLLEGCGTVDKGALRVVGETAPVPFITAFATQRLGEAETERIRRVLLGVANSPGLLVALESMIGFVEVDKEYLDRLDAPKAPAPVPPPDASAGWPNFRGPTRNGRAGWLPESLPAQPRVAWRRPLLFPGMGGLAATDKRVVLGDRDASNSLDAWRCLDAATGEEVWVVEQPAVGSLDYDNQPRATPVIDGDRVFVQGAFGDLLCVEMETGLVRWQRNLRRDFNAGGELVWGTCSTPLLFGEKLIVAPGAPEASLVALSADTGEVIWQAPGAPHAYASPLLTTLGGVRQIIAYDRTSLGGWNPTTGQRLWTLEPPTPGDFNVPTPLVVGDRLLLVSENNGARLHRFDRGGKIDPNPVASYRRLRPDMSSPVLVGGRVYCVHDQLYALNAESLRCDWVGGRRELASYGPLLATDERLLTLGRGGALLLLDARADRYRVLSRCSPFPDAAGTELYGCPALVGDRLYLRGPDAVVCLLLNHPV